MSDVAIKVSGLSKEYRLGLGPQGGGDFRDAIKSAVRRFRGPSVGEPPKNRAIWALDRVNFEVRRGEVVGVVGRNGAGKSTLLKILSRITDPSAGEAWYEGRLGSLLEVGTGFHPELSGRENIFLSGAVLGMSRREIAQRFDEIVEFSQLEQFLDTPVKRYSSGMYVRLGFAVAAHLDPDILIIDEVLAVGDADFQQKCMAKIRHAAAQGRTVLLVSHNMGSIQSLCDRALVLEGGRVMADGDPLDAVKLYVRAATAQAAVPIATRTDRRGRGRTRIVHASICSAGHEATPGVVLYGQTAYVTVEVSELLPDLACRFTVYSQLNTAICRFSSTLTAPNDAVADGRRFVCEIPDLPLIPGRYRINAAILSGETAEDLVDAAVTFSVEQGVLAGRPLTRSQRSDVFVARHRWIAPVQDQRT